MSENELHNETGSVMSDDRTEVDSQVKYFDFRRPDKFSKDQIHSIQMIHESFARLCTTALSGLLRSLVEVELALVDQMTFEEYLRTIPSSTTAAVTGMDPLIGSAVMEIDSPISFYCIEKLFGGGGETGKISRELTDIELSVMEGLVVRLLGNLREAWRVVIDLHPRLGNIETNPLFLQIVPPGEMVLYISFNVKAGNVKGKINLCFPYLVLEPIITRLSADYWYQNAKKLGGSKTEGVLVTSKEKYDIRSELQNWNKLCAMKKGGLYKIERVLSASRVFNLSENREA